MTTFQDTRNIERVTPWYQAEDRFLNERFDGYSNQQETVEQQKQLFINAVTIGYNLLKEDYEAHKFDPQFTIDFQKFFYKYTDERYGSQCMKSFIDFPVFDDLLKAFDVIIEKHRKDKHLVTNICGCNDYYCDTFCGDAYPFYKYDYHSD